MTRMRLRAEFFDDPDREKWLADLDELDRIADSAIRLVREEIAEDDSDPVRLDSLLCEVVNELSELQLDVAIADVEPAEVDIKPLALKRALRNLVINAATHGKSATVSLARKDDAFAIQIIDRGPGIPEALLKRATEPFFRVDPARSSSRGAGLGLAIAKEIIQRNSGSLTLTNAPAGGLVQTIELPAAGRA
jgi:signal transduction histidine kinase